MFHQKQRPGIEDLDVRGKSPIKRVCNLQVSKETLCRMRGAEKLVRYHQAAKLKPVTERDQLSVAAVGGLKRCAWQSAAERPAYTVLQRCGLGVDWDLRCTPQVWEKWSVMFIIPD